MTPNIVVFNFAKKEPTIVSSEEIEGFDIKNWLITNVYYAHGDKIRVLHCADSLTDAESFLLKCNILCSDIKRPAADSDVETYFTDEETYLIENTPEKKKNILISDSPPKQRPKVLETVKTNCINVCATGQKVKKQPGYIYEAPRARTKAERAKLRGQVCHECKNEFDILCKNMSPSKKDEFINRHSKHRKNTPYIHNTPPGIWEIGIIHTPNYESQPYTITGKKRKNTYIDNACPVPLTAEEEWQETKKNKVILDWNL